MNKLNYEILSAIDNIETTVMESEMNVMNSLINSYDKAITVLEYCNDNTNVDSFDIFQESVIMEADNNNGNKKSLLKKLIDLFNKAIEKLGKLFKPVIDKFKEIKNAIKNKNQINIKIVKEFKPIMERVRSISNEYLKLFESIDINNIQTDEDAETLQIDVHAVIKTQDVDGICDVIKKAIDDYKNKNEFEYINIDDAIKYISDINDMIDKCHNYSNEIASELSEEIKRSESVDYSGIHDYDLIGLSKSIILAHNKITLLFTQYTELSNLVYESFNEFKNELK